MRKVFYLFTFYITSLLLYIAVLQNACAQEVREQILFNGIIYTLKEKQPQAEAVAVRGNKIVAVGTLEMVKAQVSTNASYVDLHGNFLLPGLIDSHIHAIKGGGRLLTAHLNDELLPANELAAFASNAMEDGKGVRGDGLYITGIHSTQWTNIHELDSIFNNGKYKNIPVMLYGTDGHTGWANKILLSRAGVNKTFINSRPKVERKFYGVDKRGEPDGFLAEHAIEKVINVMEGSKVTAYEAAYSGVKHLNSLGITGWLDPSVGDTKDGDHNEMLSAYKSLSNNKLLTAHVTATIVADANGEVIPQIVTIKKLQQQVENTDHISVLGCKIFADGVLEYPTQTASTSKPYTNSGLRGSLLVIPEKLKTFVKAADQNHLLVHIHAIGDRAVTESLDAFAYTRKVNGNKRIPHSITHLQIVVPQDINRFAALNVLPSMQLLWATADRYTVDLVKPYIDPLLYTYQYPASSLINAGATLCGASDWPVSSANPFEAIAQAETRSGDMGILNDNERVSRKDMLKAYTINAAKALMMDNMIGTIEKGKQADFVLVDRDVLEVNAESIEKTKVIWTMFGGDVVYEHEEKK